MAESLIFVIIAFGVVLFMGVLFSMRWYRKVDQGKAIVRNGMGGAKVSFGGIFVLPIIHRAELIDISVKRIEISRLGKEGLICRDNLRADIKVVFFVRVNKTVDDVLKVAQSIGCTRASSQATLVELFDAKFSEALKTVGKQFEFVDLYNSRETFKNEILQIIGTDLNGYILDDAAIDFLEQTALEKLDPTNILDSEGIKKITELTAAQRVLANKIDRDREKTLKQQDVEAREQILELERQQVEAEEQQQREIAISKAREAAEAAKIQQEELLKSERARLATEEEVQIGEQNKDRQVVVAQMNKERTQAIETERVEKDRLLEVNERERIVTLANIEKERAVEEERKNIQEIIRERVTVERSVVEEEEKIKDTRATADAERSKTVAVTQALSNAEEAALREVKAAEAAKTAAELRAEQEIIEAESSQKASNMKAEARKVMAEAKAAEDATVGLAEAQVMHAKADAIERQGQVDANVHQQKASAEALGIEQKAEAMKKLDGVGREHEEFKLKLTKDKEVELSHIKTQKDIAMAQAAIIREGLRAAKIEIIGGETAFFEKILGAVAQGKSIDRMVANSTVLNDVKDTFFNGDPEYFKAQLKKFVDQFGISSEDLKNLSISALVTKMMGLAKDDQTRGILAQGLAVLGKLGIGDLPAKTLNQ